MDFHTSAGPMSGEQLVDYLNYCCYRFNREHGVSAADLAKLFTETGAAMERRYQSEGGA